MTRILNNNADKEAFKVLVILTDIQFHLLLRNFFYPTIRSEADKIINPKIHPKGNCKEPIHFEVHTTVFELVLEHLPNVIIDGQRKNNRCNGLSFDIIDLCVEHNALLLIPIPHYMHITEGGIYNFYS